MPYYNFEDTQKAAKFLASLDFTIFDTSQGDFTPEHVMYHCTLSYGGESFNTTYQSNRRLQPVVRLWWPTRHPS